MKTTKQEQEALLAKMEALKLKAFGQRDASEDDPEITAASIDFSKPIDDES